jgi:hypothetical protein
MQNGRYGPDFLELFRLFDDAFEIPKFEIVNDQVIPEPYQGLLVHPHHMTVTVENFYHGPVHVQVLDRRRDGDIYSRKILLVLALSGRVVQFGIVRIQLQHCSEKVREAILSESAPLGRILIENDVLRCIKPTAYLRITTNTQLSNYFGLAAPTDVWGRLALIHCDGRPAIELLEVLTPIH